MPPLQIVVGPIVRYVDQTSASIWLQVTAPATLGLKATPKHGDRSAKKVGSRATRTVRVGTRYYVMLYLEGLKPGTLYAYGIAWTQSGDPKSADDVFRDAGAYNAAGELDLTRWAYGKDPMFRTLPTAGKEDLRLTFGSCRCLAGGLNGSRVPTNFDGRVAVDVGRVQY